MKKRILIILMLAAAIVFATDIPFNNAMSGLVLGWHCDENTGTTAAEINGLNTLNLVGVGWVTSQTGFGYALSGVSGAYAQFSNTSNLPTGANAWSFGFRYYSTNWTVGSNYHPVLEMGSYTAGAVYMRLYVSAGKWGEDNAGSFNLISGGSANDSATLNAWTHVILVYDGVKFIRYENGVAVATSGNFTLNLKYSPAPIAESVCGSNNTSASHYWPGYEDDPALVGHAVTATEALNWSKGILPGGAMLPLKRPLIGQVIQ